MYYFSDLLYILPGLILGLWAQSRIRSAYSHYAKIRSQKGVPASAVAQALLSANGDGSVAVVPVKGNLTDHYDPRDNTLHLSEGVYDSDSLAALGIAAHEAGHALQEAENYFPMKIRKAIVPVVNFGSNLYFPLFLLGFIFSWEPLVIAGIIAFSLSVIFSLITLPVEIDASNRALLLLEEGGHITREEAPGVKKVLNAAAMTYVAAAVTSILQLLRLISINNRRR